MNSYITRNYREKYVMARIQRQRVRVGENFKLKEYESWEAAEEAARIWVEKTLPTLPEKDLGRGRMTPRNHSGFVGVHYDKGARRLAGGVVQDYPAFIARWPECPGGISWSFSTYNGEDSAFLRACICRMLETRDRDEVEEQIRNMTPPEKADIMAKKKDRA